MAVPNDYMQDKAQQANVEAKAAEYHAPYYNQDAGCVSSKGYIYGGTYYPTYGNTNETQPGVNSIAALDGITECCVAQPKAVRVED